MIRADATAPAWHSWPGFQPGAMLRRFQELHESNSVLMVTGWMHLVLLLILMAVWRFDTRLVLGINPWIKPIKFSASIAMYVWTMAWYLSYLAERWRPLHWVSRGIAGCMLVEILCILLQAARGTTSHYNVATPFDAAVFSTMGAMIALNTLLLAWTLFVLLLASPKIPPAYLWGLRIGLLLFVLASAEGGLMIVLGAHTVGARDGGPGLPFLNWSTQHGDLRIAHFVGIHALQLVPLSGYALSRSQLPGVAQVLWTMAIGLGYLALMVLLLVLAWMGQPLVAW